eukprot:CAMPEP_0117455870 /NCGR_PEP_ID=MMETSP0759-20121206/11585_1 /TAXON_ID=63605 /ORGANISM="Percolomonas cosmopolitus, Strain WS" /LENGTH=505 /DNA_ID=CAMNT_0005249193 /DNA_START=74 /DNA_END=1589 /DNA_ORIENTATION=-
MPKRKKPQSSSDEDDNDMDSSDFDTSEFDEMLATPLSAASNSLFVSNVYGKDDEFQMEEYEEDDDDDDDEDMEVFEDASSSEEEGETDSSEDEKVEDENKVENPPAQKHASDNVKKTINHPTLSPSNAKATTHNKSKSDPSSEETLPLKAESSPSQASPHPAANVASRTKKGSLPLSTLSAFVFQKKPSPRLPDAPSPNSDASLQSNPQKSSLKPLSILAKPIPMIVNRTTKNSPSPLTAALVRTTGNSSLVQSRLKFFGSSSSADSGSPRTEVVAPSSASSSTSSSNGHGMNQRKLSNFIGPKPAQETPSTRRPSPKKLTNFITTTSVKVSTAPPSTQLAIEPTEVKALVLEPAAKSTKKGSLAKLVESTQLPPASITAQETLSQISVKNVTKPPTKEGSFATKPKSKSSKSQPTLLAMIEKSSVPSPLVSTTTSQSATPSPLIVISDEDDDHVSSEDEFPMEDGVEPIERDLFHVSVPEPATSRKRKRSSTSSDGSASQTKLD